MVRSGLVLNGIVHWYCLDVVPCKILSSWLEKHIVMDNLMVFCLVWYGYVWFGLVLHGMVHAYCLDVDP